MPTNVVLIMYRVPLTRYSGLANSVSSNSSVSDSSSMVFSFRLHAFMTTTDQADISTAKKGVTGKFKSCLIRIASWKAKLMRAGQNIQFVM